MQHHIFKASKFQIVASLLLVATLLGIPIWGEYLHGGFLFYFTLALGPFIFYVRQPNFASTRYAWSSIICLLGHLFLGINILFLAGYLFFALFLIEWKWGKLNELSIYWIFLLSPLTIFFFGVFSFPIRLKLSELATWMLRFFFEDAICQGNIILLQGAEFSVDEACMGLKMVSYSYLAMLVLIAYFEKRKKKQLSRPHIVAILSVGTILILLANLIRIILIIITHAMPDSLGHELIGVICWLVYVILPSYFISKVAVQKWAKAWQVQSEKVLKPSFARILTASSILLLGIGGFQNIVEDKSPPKAIIEFSSKNFDKSIAADGVLQLKNEEALIYIKPACAPYRADHAPNICWKGSGYQFKKEAQKTIAGVELMRAELHKNKDVLYTVWWYDNGSHNTASQLVWRWNSLKGNGNYQLINITTDDPALLKKYIEVITN